MNTYSSNNSISTHLSVTPLQLKNMGDTKSEVNSKKRMFVRSTSSAVPRRSNGSSNLSFLRAKSVPDVQTHNQKRYAT